MIIDLLEDGGQGEVSNRPEHPRVDDAANGGALGRLVLVQRIPIIVGRDGDRSAAPEHDAKPSAGKGR
jgi:hypothetical protein